MPYTVRKQGDQFCVFKESGGESLGCHPTEGEAQAQVAAIYAHEGKSMSKKGSIGNPVANLAARAEMSLMKLGQYARPVSAMAGKLDALAFASNDPDRAETLRTMANQARMLSAYLRNAAGYRIPDKLPSLVDGINRITNILRSQALPLYRVFLDYSERIPREVWRQAEQGQSLRVGNETIITINVLQRFLKEARMLNASHGNETPGVLSVGKKAIPSDFFDAIDQVYSGIFGALYDNLAATGQRFISWSRADNRQEQASLSNEQHSALLQSANLIRSAVGDLSLLRNMKDERQQRHGIGGWAFANNLNVYATNLRKAAGKIAQSISLIKNGNLVQVLPPAASKLTFLTNASGVLSRSLTTMQGLIGRAKQRDYSQGKETPGVLHTNIHKKKVTMIKTKVKQPTTRKGQGHTKPLFGQFFGKPKEKPFPTTDYSEKTREARKRLIAGLEAEQKFIAKQVWQSKLQPALNIIQEAENALPGVTFAALASMFRVATAMLDQIYRDNQTVLEQQKQLYAQGKSVTLASKIDAATIKAAKSLREAAVKARQHIKQFPSRYPTAPDALGLGQREGGQTAIREAKKELVYQRYLLDGLKRENEALDAIYSQHVNALLALVMRAESADPTSQKFTAVFDKLRQADRWAVRQYQVNEKRIQQAKATINQLVRQYVG